ncbi:YcgN family cysteine cluster protein [Acetobacteraceae bacterium ESL0709]|nr:YcgN family cysteine cluster protein [Acetobacteraceae bacterium ESL0697]MDF7677329.1 YcgN family cysteine cluster protein [Acetobacteraceae bacterium ESL0709]
MTEDIPFWKNTALKDMTRSQWESLCDGCGRCCLHKFREDDTDEILWTNVGCRLLDQDTCLCRDYTKRLRRVRDCVTLTPELLETLDWLPPSCAYRLIRDGLELPDWHPLISGTKETVHLSGASVRYRFINERSVTILEDHFAEWPGEWPEPITTEQK